MLINIYTFLKLLIEMNTGIHKHAVQIDIVFNKNTTQTLSIQGGVQLRHKISSMFLDVSRFA